MASRDQMRRLLILGLTVASYILVNSMHTVVVSFATHSQKGVSSGEHLLQGTAVLKFYTAHAQIWNK